MALELVGGAVLGAAVQQLLKAVIDAKDKATTDFHEALTSLESTLQSVIPRVNEITRLIHELKGSDEEMKELITILRNGQALVNKSSTISSINFFKKVKHSKRLVKLDDSLLRYFQTILLLDHSIDTKEILLMVRELRRGLVGAKDEGESSKPKEDESSREPDEGESSKPKVDEYSDQIKSCHEPNEEGESSKPKVDEYSDQIKSCQDPGKQETVIPAKTMVIIEKPVRKLDTWTFRLKGGCTYIFDLKDKILDPNDSSYTSHFPEYKYESRAFYQDKRKFDVRNCECKIKHGYVMVGYIEIEGEIGKSEFKQQMETYGRIGNHPNIVPPFGYCFYQSDLFQYDLFLFYDSFLEGGSLFTRLHEYKGRRIEHYEYPVSNESREFIWESKVKISLGVARGISHLHSVKCIHGNLHSSNILLNLKHDGCISDYGFLDFSSAARKSDVHSFGVILLEMLSRTEPLENRIKTCYFGSEEALHWWIAKVVRDLDEIVGFKIDNEAREMLKIAMLCVEKDLDKRPEMDDVVKMIQQIQPSRKRIAYSYFS